MNEHPIWKHVDENSIRFHQLAEKVWDSPETCYAERLSVQAHLEELEYQKCMQDPAYFARTYVKIISLDEGLVPFDLYPYQEEMFKHFISFVPRIILLTIDFEPVSCSSTSSYNIQDCFCPNRF